MQTIPYCAAKFSTCTLTNQYCREGIAILVYIVHIIVVILQCLLNRLFTAGALLSFLRIPTAQSMADSHSVEQLRQEVETLKNTIRVSDCYLGTLG